MILTAVFLILPFVVADGLHKLKLHKLPPAASNPALETAYLAEKYGIGTTQIPIMGAGGAGRRFARPSMKNGEDLFWTQEELTGSHRVPLSSL
jgi:saccharopepsin